MDRARAAYGFGTTIDAPLDEAIARTTAALKAEGFGVLTTIDVRATLQDKLGVDFEPYVILGACNPDLAWRGLHADHELGLLLPCNVIVHQHGDRSRVAAVDPMLMLSVVGDNPAVRVVGEEAADRLHRVIDALAASDKGCPDWRARADHDESIVARGLFPPIAFFG